MKKTLVTLTLLCSTFILSEAQEWKPAGDKILTSWGEQLDPTNPHSEYPRPQLQRKGNWQNLNGLWQYTINSKEHNDIPTQWDGDILVPFAVESALSGVGRSLNKDQVLWYHREIKVDKKVRNGRTLLHFGAVDWQCDVYVNGQHLGRHEGGFDPFSFDITNALKKGEKQEITLRVWDPTSDGPQPRGKQINNPHGIWYTPVSGIWQTVWLEGVPETYIVRTKQTPDVDNAQLHLSTEVAQAQPNDLIIVEAYDQQTKVAETSAAPNEAFILPIPNAQLSSPNSPK